MPKKTLRQLCDELYDDPQLADAVFEDAHKNQTVERIESGELKLPHPGDARNWHDRITGKAGMTPTERSQDDRIKALEAALAQKKEGE